MNEIERATASKVYFDATSTIRHYDKERTASHRVALAVLSGLLSVGSSDLFLDDNASVVVSVVGALISVIFYMISDRYGELIEREKSRARTARRLLDQGGDRAIATIDEAKREMMSDVLVKYAKLSSLWGLYYLVFVLGFIALAINSAQS